MGNLDKLLYWRGIGHEYVNYRGDNVSVSMENRMNLLHAMEVDTGSDESITTQVHELDVMPWYQWLAPFVLSELNNGVCFQINLAPEFLNKEFEYTVTLEAGGEQKGVFVPSSFPEVGDYIHDHIRFSKRSIQVQGIPLGYHKLQIGIPSAPELKSPNSEFVVVPKQAYTPDWVTKNDKPWGIIVQLYTLRSNRNWGIGDFSDLKKLIVEAAAAGADMIGLNPLHALREPVQHHCSPYSPSDRRFLNPLYIDPEVEPDYRFINGSFVNEAESLRKPKQVDYAGVNTLKTKVFKGMYAAFIENELKASSARYQQFLDYVEGDETLQDYCLYQVVSEHSEKPIDQLSVSEKQAFTEDFADEIQFQAYLQWLANTQLDKCQALSKQKGMTVGLMRDLAVGADGGGAEVSTNLDLFCRDAAVGAPPDPLAEMGQNWGLPPMDPSVLKATNFAHFIHLLKANMSHCGALRIDHAMSLMRLWWCPPGNTADFGAYVYYPFEQMLGLLKLESVRNQCMVIGEDMGVVPPEFRQALVESNIFTNKMFYFEKQNDGRFTPPNDYFPRSLSMLTNHDVPTITSWWAETDLELRQSLDLLEEGVDFNDVLEQRRTEKKRLLEWLHDLQLIPFEKFDGFLSNPMTRELAALVLQGVSCCGSQLYAIQLEDLELLDAPVNVPGTSTQYANWQRKLTVPLEDLFGDQGVQTLLRSIASQRGGTK